MIVRSEVFVFVSFEILQVIVAKMPLYLQKCIDNAENVGYHYDKANDDEDDLSPSSYETLLLGHRAEISE